MTRYENKIIMPTGPLTGRVGLTNLSRDEVANEFRWHGREWHSFLDEVRAYRKKMGWALYDKAMRLYDRAQKCPKCAARRRALMRPFRGPHKQRGSILLSAFQGSAAAGDCSFTASTIPNLSRFAIEPTNADTRARLHSDGDWYSNASFSVGSWGTSDGTWDGDCAIADYDTRWNQASGSTLTGSSGSDGVWSAATNTKEVWYSITGIGFLQGVFDLECRDGTSLNVLFTDGFSMTCEVDARN
jgi:hypothetical protein